MLFQKLLFVAAAALILVGCGAQATPTPTQTPAPNSDLRGAVFNPPRTLTDFSIPSSAGKPFTLADYRGEVVLLYFGYLTCPDVCPTTLAELQNVYTKLNKPADKLKVVFVSVDPERDTLENMTRYTQAFSPDFIAARTEGDDLTALMQQFGVTATKRQLSTESSLAYLVDHTASVFLIDPDGRLLAQYLYGTDYRDIVQDLKSILQLA